MIWKDKIENAGLRDGIDALDRVLSDGEFPALEQSELVEAGGLPVRFTVDLQINRDEHHQPPTIFILATSAGRIGGNVQEKNKATFF